MVDISDKVEGLKVEEIDEKAFLRRARMASILRTSVISLMVVVGAMLGLFVCPELVLQRQEARIDSFYPDLVQFTEPNTVALAGNSVNVRLFGRQKQYHLLRLVGHKPCPAGTVTVDFDVWGGERTLEDPTFVVCTGSWDVLEKISTGIPEGSKEYSALGVPRLRFYYPVAEGQEVRREFDVLDNVGDGCLVEMAVSFREPLSVDEVRSVMPPELRLMWGAVCVFSDEEYRNRTYLAGTRVVGNPFMGSPEGERKFLETLERLSKVPSHHSGNIRRTVDFLKANGVRYYGAVVVGSPGVVANETRIGSSGNWCGAGDCDNGVLTGPEVHLVIGTRAPFRASLKPGYRGGEGLGVGAGLRALALAAMVIVGLVVFAGAGAMAEESIRLVVDGREILPDVAPRLIDGRVMVPLRWVAEALGARVEWDETTRTVTIASQQSWSAVVDAAERRAAMLERCLRPESPAWVAHTWARAVKERNGALQFALLSPELRAKYRSAFERCGWVTGVSSPWVESYAVTCVGRSDGVYTYEIRFRMVASTGYAGEYSARVVVTEWYDEAAGSKKWLVSEVNYPYEGAYLSQ
ncbi:MAG: sigma factor regulator N-terminal domain-containing protein [Bacillota bacterium]